MDLKKYLGEKKKLVEESMEALMYAPRGLQEDHARHIEAMGYSLFAGGKRIRPILCLAACSAVGGVEDNAIPAAVSLECIHTYSLIHDDLPAMDDDDLRRGKPTNHTIYGEAGAILAGDGLLTLAFELLARNSKLEAAEQLQIIRLIAEGSGSMGMVGGQAIDIACEGKKIDFETLKQIHRRKTGALLTAAVQAGAVVGGASEAQFQALTDYGNEIGLAFQIVDDLLNVEGTTEELGKAAGSDAERQKSTYPAFFGIEETRRKAEEAVARALASLETFDRKAEPLREIAHYIRKRKN
ncbi:MAG: polyprenyl synthetase family protein [Proteobacteria bacterium]|nr:polyprenyl synthetase family protein [Pseudomonadota bacterium]MBU1739271.1 polyprenyl synthetase family protein [Pseudomonadota bacterium]